MKTATLANSRRTSTTRDGKLMRIAIGDLVPHPANPRLVLREDVVDSIAAQLKEAGRFSDMHALIVRPIEDEKYQILSGHQRTEAARKADIVEIPCWVIGMDDEAAHMLLATCNSQGELDPLEIGIHAYEAVPLEKGGRGKKGGISSYAAILGKQKRTVSDLRLGAEVVIKTGNISAQFLGRAYHLAVIHDANERAWATLCKHLIEKNWSVEDTKHYVARVNEFGIPSAWETEFLPYEAVIEHFLATREFSPQTVKALVKQAGETLVLIHEQAGKVDDVFYAKAYHAWLKENAGSDSWDIRQLFDYHRRLETEFADCGKENAWLHGDWREHLPKLPDESIAVLLADPPYGIHFQSDYRLDRRIGRKHEPIANDRGDAFREIEEMLEVVEPKLMDDAHIFLFCHWSEESRVREIIEAAGYNVRGSLVWVKNNTGMGDPKTTFAPKHERIIHAVKGSPYLSEREADVLLADRVPSDNHPTEKPVSLLRRLIEITTVEGQLVADPFGGVASTMVAAKECGRRYWGCEINEEYWKHGATRVEPC
jgi:site-specific DNA-methyltransferase (adenine-specific)